MLMAGKGRKGTSTRKAAEKGTFFIVGFWGLFCF